MRVVATRASQGLSRTCARYAHRLLLLLPSLLLLLSLLSLLQLTSPLLTLCHAPPARKYATQRLHADCRW